MLKDSYNNIFLLHLQAKHNFETFEGTAPSLSEKKIQEMGRERILGSSDGEWQNYKNRKEEDAASPEQKSCLPTREFDISHLRFVFQEVSCYKKILKGTLQ